MANGKSLTYSMRTLFKLLTVSRWWKRHHGQHFWKPPKHCSYSWEEQGNRHTLCFNFEHINQARIERALLDLNVRKSFGHDMLSPRLVKESASVIAKPITNILNTLSKVATPMSGKWDRSHVCLKKTRNLIKQITGLSQCYLCLIISTKDYWQRSWVNFTALFCSTVVLQLYSCETAFLRLTAFSTPVLTGLGMRP